MPSRYEMATGKSEPKKDALTQALDMLKKPMTSVPQKAKDYAGFLCAKYGGCMEVLVTAYAHYAQAENGAPCGDDAYRIQEEGIQWFREHSPGTYPLHGWDGDWGTAQKTLQKFPKWDQKAKEAFKHPTMMEENEPTKEES